MKKLILVIENSIKWQIAIAILLIILCLNEVIKVGEIAQIVMACIAYIALNNWKNQKRIEFTSQRIESLLKAIFNIKILLPQLKDQYSYIFSLSEDDARRLDQETIPQTKKAIHHEMSSVEIMLLYLDIDRSTDDVFSKIFHYYYQGDLILLDSDFMKYSKEIKEIIIKKFPEETKLIFCKNNKIN